MNPLLSFVRATLGDVPRIEALVSDAYTPYIARIGREPAPMRADFTAAVEAGRVLLALRDSWLAGVLVTEVHADCLLVENVAVDPQAQGMGVGAQLLSRADDEAMSLGLSEVRLYTNTKMIENLSYYPRRGYREVERRTENGFERVYFSRVLT